MRLAVPITAAGQFCPHFGRCDGVWLAELDETSSAISRPRPVLRPDNKCDSLADWIHSLAVDVVLAHGIGAVARGRLRELGAQVVTGLCGETPESVVEAYRRHPEGDPNACMPSEHRFRHCAE